MKIISFASVLLFFVSFSAFAANNGPDNGLSAGQTQQPRESSGGYGSANGVGGRWGHTPREYSPDPSSGSGPNRGGPGGRWGHTPGHS